MVYSDVSFSQNSRSGVKRFVIGSAFLAAAGLACGAPAAAAPTLTVLHSFTGYPDGIEPSGRLAMDSGGALYGTTYAGGMTGGGWGTVFMLTPPPVGKTQWTKTLLYAFTNGADGSHPRGGVIIDSKGALYGTTADGGLAGKVFKLTPPPAGKTQWTYTVLHSFGSGNDGNTPLAGLIMDSTGALYGTTAYGGGYSYYGTVFKLTPPATGITQWTETVLHRFRQVGDAFGPYAGLTFDSNGALYGTTYFGGTLGFGTVFKLAPPALGNTAWTETVLYSFKGGTDGYNLVAGVSVDSKGVLYGTTPNHPIGGQCGTVYRLTPPVPNQTQWTETVLYNFDNGVNGCGPRASVILDSTGALYGTTSEGILKVGGGTGTLFKLTPPAAGKTLWTESVLYIFKNGTDGSDPESDLIFDKNGALYGVTTLGSSVAGALFELH
jgi:uncharacterized repeat protein (TIGR03803 family)